MCVKSFKILIIFFSYFYCVKIEMYVFILPSDICFGADWFSFYWRLYAFDVHCNSFFPMFVILYGNFTFLLLIGFVLLELDFCSHYVTGFFFFCSYTLLSFTSFGSPWFYTRTTIESTFHGGGLLLPLSQLLGLWW